MSRFLFSIITLASATIFLADARLEAQEADSGFDLRATLSSAAIYSRELAESPRQEEPFDGAFRAVLYPTWKLSSHWTFAGAVQVHNEPYFAEQFEYPGHRVHTDVLQAHLSYSRFWKNASVVARVGQMTSAFGSFLLRYDSNDNPLVRMPQSYGYDYKPVTSLGLVGAQVDATIHQADLRVQFTNSSPANRQSIFDHDQYGTWTVGGGYTIRQGFRIGASMYRGPYLDRQYRFFFRGEAAPRTLPATAVGLDVQWGRGPWNAWGEWQRFQMDYRLIPTFTQHTGFAEIRRVLNPRWYIAERAGYLRASAFRGSEAYETAVGFRPNRHQLLKFDYIVQRGAAIHGAQNNAAVIELVTTIHPISIARN